MFENIKTYFEGTKAYLLFLRAELKGITEFKDFILDKKYQAGAILASLSSLLLATKEDIVENEGELVYSSKVFDDSLLKSINMIANLEADGINLDNYLFSDKENLIATIRNKVAHGDYEIDFDSNSIILNIKNNKVKVNINKLSKFIVSAFQTTIKDYKGNTYKRNVISLKIEKNKKIKNDQDIKEILKEFKNDIFEIKNDNEIDKECRGLLESFLKIYREKGEESLKNPIYQKMLEHFKKNNHIFNRTLKKLSEEEIEELVETLNKCGIFELKSNFERLEMIKIKIAKHFNAINPKFDLALSNLKNLIMIDSISKVNSVEHKKIENELYSNYGHMAISSYEFATSVINMFVSLYMYPFEKYYMTTKEYQEEKKDLDFALLDTSLFNVEVLTINDNPLIEMKTRCDSCLKKSETLSELVEKCKQNLENVKNKGNKKAQELIENQLEQLEKQLKTIKEDTVETKKIYDKMQNDYSSNSNFFKNQGIINGIRNSIAHGNYKIVISDNPTIVFEDIYEEKLAFKASITISDFYTFIDENADIVLNLVKGKEK